jgi:hypothetical protein
MQKTDVVMRGDVVITLEDKDSGKVEVLKFKNKILKPGRAAMAKTVSNLFGGNFQYFVNVIAFGDGGTSGGTPKYIDDSRTGLFGSVVALKPVIATIDSNIDNQVVFTSVLTYDDAVGSNVSEMALKMNNGNYFSMVTFGDIAKSSSMQITFNWMITFV